MTTVFISEMSVGYDPIKSDTGVVGCTLIAHSVLFALRSR